MVSAVAVTTSANDKDLLIILKHCRDSYNYRNVVNIKPREMQKLETPVSAVFMQLQLNDSANLYVGDHVQLDIVIARQ